MSFSIAIDPQTATAIVTTSGVLGAKEAREFVTALWSQPGWDGRTVIWDFRESRFELSPSDTRDVAVFILRNQPPTPPTRVAFVTGRDADFGMARMFQVFREDPTTAFRVFRDFGEAVAWTQRSEGGAG